MRWNCWLALALMLFMTACASRRGPKVDKTFPETRTPAAASPAPASAPVSPTPTRPTPNAGGTIVTPGVPKVGRVSLVNGSARYVIVTFGVGQLPVRDAWLHVYRDGLKVAELRVTDFTRDINAAADIMAGECRVGDEVRVP
jgi:hypothetical protein